jgi:opacity protein-like surface antigen
MKQIRNLMLAAIAIACLTGNVLAGTFGVGVAGSRVHISASGTEKEASGTAALSGTVERDTAANQAFIGSMFAEYAFDNGVTFGVDYIPGEADINDVKRSRTDASDANEADPADGTKTVNAQLSDHITYYAEVPVAGLYAKVGLAQVDVKVKHTSTSTAANQSTYKDKTLDGLLLGLGYKGDFGGSLYYKLEASYTDYDSYTNQSTGGDDAYNVSADMDVTQASLRLGYAF